MRQEVTVRFALGHQIEIPVSTGQLPESDEARQWMDGEFNRLECEPLRDSGKVLTVDKLLAVASAVGAEAFDDGDWSQRYASSVLSILDRPAARVDLVNMRVSY